jgi:hypothetical protein
MMEVQILPRNTNQKFSLVKVDFFIRKIPTQPVRGHYKSTDPYLKLLVIDKVNGKCKADASNASTRLNIPLYLY